MKVSAKGYQSPITCANLIQQSPTGAEDCLVPMSNAAVEAS